MHSKLAGRRLARLAAATLVATLAACGGGGDDDGGSVVRVSEATTLAPTAVTTVDTATTRWMPSLNDTWQLQLQGTINTSYNVAVYDIDLFDAPQATINALKAQEKKDAAIGGLVTDLQGVKDIYDALPSVKNNPDAADDTEKEMTLTDDEVGSLTKKIGELRTKFING